MAASQAHVNSDAVTSASGSNNDAVYQRLHSWDWSSDSTFQAGIDSIVKPLQNAGRSNQEIADVVRRAQVFYFCQQTGEKITPDGYAAWLRANAPEQGSSAAQPATQPTSAPPAATVSAYTDDDAEREPYPASFDAIAELIATGRTDQIPGIREIPVEISDEPASEAKLAPRPKPWENSESAPAPFAPQPPISTPAGFETVSEIGVAPS
ncbi:hypothetical protein OC845_002640 [Tilletia horrida]|nr:hypothetical protein OC845_002640 [Tilletia horrida]